MNEEPTQPNASTPTAAPPPKPDYVGQSNIIDRSNSQRESPPAAVTSPDTNSTTGNQQEFNNRYQEASSDFTEAKVLISGVASSTSYILIIYVVKNLWITAAISAILALAAIFFAVSEYRKSNKAGPLTIVGLSAATITLVSIANILITQAFLHSVTSNYMF